MLNYSANGPSGYNLTNSLRFRSSASAYLNRTPASAGNRQIMTYSFWVKRGAITGDYNLTNATTDASNSATLYFNSSNNQTFDVFLRVGATNYSLTTSQVFRDPSAWYHIIVAIDTTQATASNRTKVYVNGLQVTNFLTANYVPQNSNLALNNNVAQYIGFSNYFDGYMTEINFIDGQALTPSSFGNTNSTTGVWQPAKYTGTYGTNGFYLPMSITSNFMQSATVNTASTYAGIFESGFNNYISLPANTAMNPGTGDFTMEFWLYATSGTALQGIVDIGFNSGGYGFYSQATNELNFRINGSDIVTTYTSYFNKWTHVAATRSGSSVRIFLDGVQQGSTATNSTNITTSSTCYIGTFNSTSYSLKGMLSNVRIVKGTALYTTNFTPPTSPLTAVSGTGLLTLQSSSVVDNSTNAFTLTSVNLILPEKSGNNNIWFPNNISITSGTTYDAMIDSPTNTSSGTQPVGNYCVMNPLALGTDATLSNANLTISYGTGGSGQKSTPATMAASSGKWYYEFICTASTISPVRPVIGIQASSMPTNEFPGYGDPNAWGMYLSDGNKFNNNTSGGVSYGSSFAVNDIAMCAFDLDNGKIWWGKNGTWFASGDPAAGTNAAFTNVTGTLFPAIGDGSGTQTFTGSMNFGQRPFSYTPPTGFKSLCTTNLPDSTIVQGNKYMDATLYTGNGSTQSITNAAGFQPDLIWNKARSNADTNSNMLVNSNLGRAYSLSSNQTSNEGTSPAGYDLVSFNSNGFTVGPASQADMNTNAWTFVCWQWKCNGGTNTTNTNGSITSTVQVNTTTGLSIVSWTGNGSNATIGHGLNVTPKMVILRPRTVTGGSDWAVYNSNLTSAAYAVFLNKNIAQTSYPTIFNSTAPTSTVFSVGTGYNINAAPMIAYCWAEIDGFSKFGSYVGNGSTDGNFVYLGFRPKFIMFKNTSIAEGWQIRDTSRDTYNACQYELYPNSSAAEGNSGSRSPTDYMDILSNGFKLRGNNAELNNGTGTNVYIYAAFAENPFKNSLAR